MTIENLLSRLAKVKKRGQGSWVACCPVHNDRSPSMTIRELEDGRVLVHCFAGCSVDEIIGFLGMSFSDLYPPNPIENGKPLSRMFAAADVLEALAHETQIIAVAALNLDKLTSEDRQRVILAAQRINEGRRLANG